MFSKKKTTIIARILGGLLIIAMVLPLILNVT